MKIVIVGVGYVGIHLISIFQQKYKVVGYDCDYDKINSLNKGIDRSGEMSLDNLISMKNVSFTCDINDISKADVYIVSVPTPISAGNDPDMTALFNAMETIGKVLQCGNAVIIESTIYPGVTEKICVPILKRFSGLSIEDFYVGFSPERINPGDKEHMPEKCEKIVSGIDEKSQKFIYDLYNSVWDAPIYKASSIQVAEGAKLLENIQRDVNIALINEVNLLYRKIGIDIYDVIDAASGKWNFMPFFPGLVGGHCIGVDPYYLIDLAKKEKMDLSIIECARTVNEQVPNIIANELLGLFKPCSVNMKVGVLGITFKENCSDIRNSKVVKIVNDLVNVGCEVRVSDPIANPDCVNKEYGIMLTDWKEWKEVNMLILAVSHDEFDSKMLSQIVETMTEYGGDRPVLADIKGIVKPDLIAKLNEVNIRYWRY